MGEYHPWRQRLTNPARLSCRLREVGPGTTPRRAFVRRGCGSDRLSCTSSEKGKKVYNSSKYRFIDWVMLLPEELELEYDRRVDEYQEEHKPVKRRCVGVV